MNLPTREECKHLITVMFRMPDNIMQHSIQVNRVAMLLAIGLKQKGVDVNLDLVDRASILHDILKIAELHDFSFITNPPGQQKVFTISKKDRDRWEELREKYAGISHEEAAYTVFKEKYPEMAEVILKHRYTAPIDGEGLKTWEEKIVNYADKRVKHTEIVSLKERFEDGHKRYSLRYPEWGLDKEKTAIIDSRFFELEKEIFEKLDFKPDDIAKILADEDNRVRQDG